MSQQMKTAIVNLNAAVASWEDTKAKMSDLIVRFNAFVTASGDDSADAAAVQAVADQLKADGAALLNEIAPNPGTPPVDPSAPPATA